MKYATYSQIATKIGKDDEGRLIYSVLPNNQFESNDIVKVLDEFASAINGMSGKDRLIKRVSVKEVGDATTDDYTVVICAEYVPVDDSARIARVVFD